MEEILSGRAKLIELVLVAIFLGLGVNLIAGTLPLVFVVSPIMILIFGLVVCSTSSAYLASQFLGRRSLSRKYQGFFVYDKKNNKVVKVARYRYTEGLIMYLDAAFSENKALETVWTKDPLRDIYARGKNSLSKAEHCRALPIIREATEYFVLEALSTHLTDYFNDVKFRKENLREFVRNDVPDLWTKNRFMELFSRPMADRSAFVEEAISNQEFKGEIVYVSGPGEALYSKFDLILPKESVIHRLDDDIVRIETRRLVMSIRVRFEGFSAFVPAEFIEHYISLHALRDVMVFQVEVDVRVSFKFAKLLSRTGWEYYRWVDSFLDKLDELLSGAAFFKSIGWDSAFTVIHSLAMRANQKQHLLKVKKESRRASARR